MRREVYHRESKSIYFTLAFAGIALMAAVIVGVAVLRRRNARSPQNQVSVYETKTIIVSEIQLSQTKKNHT